MATIVYRNAYFWVNGVDYSADMESLGLTYSAEMLDETAMGDDTRINKGGLKNWSIECNAHMDNVAAHVGANLFALVGTTTCIELRSQNTCTTGINPSFTCIGILEDFPPLAGSVGSLLDVSFKFASAGTLARSVAAS